MPQVKLTNTITLTQKKFPGGHRVDVKCPICGVASIFPVVNKQEVGDFIECPHCKETLVIESIKDTV
jgi:hypothetical protein